MLPCPAEIERFAYARIDHAVADDGDDIAGQGLEAGFIHAFTGVFVIFAFEFHALAVADIDAEGIVKLREVAFATILNLQDTEGGVGHLAHVAHGQGVDDGRYHLRHGRALAHHGRADRAGEGGEDIRLHAAAEAIGQHGDGGVRRAHGDDLVATELLALFIEAFPCNVDMYAHSESSLKPACRRGRSYP